MAFGLLTGTEGINADFLRRLEALRRALPNNLGAQVGLKSGYRSPARQAELFARAVQKYGSPAAARKWVAPPGRSRHNLGLAVDLSYGSPAAEQAAHQYASQFGLVFPMSYENWHIEPVGARGASAGNVISSGNSPAVPAPGGAVSASPDTSSPVSAVSDILSRASFPSASSPGASSGVSQVTGAGLGPAPQYDLQVADLSDTNAAPAASPSPGIDDLTPLAGLFTLPAIGQGAANPDDYLPGALPGQAKAATRPSARWNT